jgi:hypothetical protein
MNYQCNNKYSYGYSNVKNSFNYELLKFSFGKRNKLSVSRRNISFQANGGGAGLLFFILIAGPLMAAFVAFCIGIPFLAYAGYSYNTGYSGHSEEELKEFFIVGGVFTGIGGLGLFIGLTVLLIFGILNAYWDYQYNKKNKYYEKKDPERIK